MALWVSFTNGCTGRNDTLKFILICKDEKVKRTKNKLKDSWMEWKKKEKKEGRSKRKGDQMYGQCTLQGSKEDGE